jgi:hypothetical protein
MLASIRQSRSIYSYIFLACLAALWQWWCLQRGGNNTFAIVTLILLMGLPFALATYVYAASAVPPAVPRRRWRGMLVLWAGMPISLVAGISIIGAQTAIMYAAGFRDDLPLYTVRLVIGEACACLAWALCLQTSLRQMGPNRERRRFPGLFVALFAGVLFVEVLSWLTLRYWHKDIFFISLSIVVTVISALALSVKMGVRTSNVSAR